MDSNEVPTIEFSDNTITDNSLVFNAGASSWVSEFVFEAVYDVMDVEEEYDNINLTVVEGLDTGGNPMNAATESVINLLVDTKNPTIVDAVPSVAVVTNAVEGPDGFSIEIQFDEPMGPFTMPVVTFPSDELNGALVQSISGFWQDASTYVATFDVNPIAIVVGNVDIQVTQTNDENENPLLANIAADVFSISLVASVDEWNLDGNLSVYPNPVASGNNITLQMSRVPSDLSVSLLDASGKLVKMLAIQNQGGNQIEISTSGLSAGNYFLQLNSGVDGAVLKFTVTK
ncbi:MAG: T9SS type A sorting domain-containing protein [Flavobacteriales bacterium]